LLASDGITLEVISTAGTIENLELLKRGDVSLALVQGGCATEADRADLQSLGSVFLEAEARRLSSAFPSLKGSQAKTFDRLRGTGVRKSTPSPAALQSPARGQRGDKVATCITGSGRHVGPLLGIPPTNRMVTMSGIAIHRVANGRLAEHWGHVDAVSLLAQMGAFPAPPQPPPLPAPDIQRAANDAVTDAGRAKATLRRLFDEAINKTNPDVMNELLDSRLGLLVHLGAIPAPQG
jgi:hypothetical protein